MKKLDTPYKLGDDYFIDSKLHVPFYQVALHKEIEFSMRSGPPELPCEESCVVGIFIKTAQSNGDVHTYKLDINESKLKKYKPRCQWCGVKHEGFKEGK